MSDLTDAELQMSQQPESIPFETVDNTGIIIWALTNATLGTYIAFTLLSRFNELAKRRATVVLPAAFSFSLGCWACQLSTSRIHFVPPPNEIRTELFIGFNLAFVVLSLSAPSVLVIGAFFLLDLQSRGSNDDRSVIWKCCGCGLVVGLSVSLMHYCPFFSLPSFIATFAPAQVFLVLLLNISGSLFSFLALAFCISKCRTTPKFVYALFVLISLVFASCVVGAGVLARSGMKFEPRGEHVGELGEGGQKQRDTLTRAVPASISGVLACAAVLLIFASRSKPRTIHPSAPQLILASIAFTDDGSVLVNQKGMLPTQCVNLEGFQENVLEELDFRRPTIFHWLLAISFDWSIISPFLQYISPISASPDKPPSLWRSMFYSFTLATFLTFFRAKSQSEAVPTQAKLKLRLLAAVTQLVAQLDLPLEKLGTLHDRALETGTRMGIAEFLLLSEHAASQLRDAEEALKENAEANKGLMLFFVRTLPHPPSDAVLRIRSRQVGDGARGFNMRFMGRFRDGLAETTGAKPADVDKVLHRCKNTVSRRERSVLEAGCTYVSLFAEKVSCDGSSEVLVYDFARHQLPSYRMDLQTLTPEMRNWFHGMSGFTASDIIQICKDEAEQGRLHLSLSSHSFDNHAFRCEEEHLQVALLEFKEGLATALAQLMRDMSFVDESLETWTYLTSHIWDVPSVRSASDEETPAPAHMIVFHAECPDPLELENESDLAHISSSSVEQSMHPTIPSAFQVEYIPRALFDVIHALAVSQPAREAFRREATHELELLYDAGASSTNQGAEAPLNTLHTGPGRLSRALVSSFSIDTMCEDDERTRSTVARVRKSWAAIKTRARALKPPSRNGRLIETRNNRIPLSHSASRTQLLSHSHSGSSSTATTSTVTSSSIREPHPQPLQPKLYPHSRSTVDLKSTSHAARTSTSPRSADRGGSAGRSRTRSVSRSDSRKSRWQEPTEHVRIPLPIPIPPLPSRVGLGLLAATTRNGAASKSVPNVAATKRGFF